MTPATRAARRAFTHVLGRVAIAWTLAAALCAADARDAAGAPSPAAGATGSDGAADPLADTEAARAMIRRLVDPSAFPEVTRGLRALGDAAVPALIEARASPMLHTWATDQLEALGKRTPGDAVQISDQRILCEVLAAYGETTDMDALPTVLAFVSADRPDVRAAARASVTAYGERAARRLASALAAWSGGTQPRGSLAADAGRPTAAELASRLFAASDRHRLEDIDGLMDRGEASADAGALGDAVAAFDEALARQPVFDRRAEAVPTYVAFGESLASSDPDRAEAYLRKAIRLDPTGSPAKRAQSRLDLIDGQALRAHGVADPEPFVSALALDPTNDEARAELERLREDAKTTRQGARHAATGTLALGIALAAIAGIAIARLRR